MTEPNQSQDSTILRKFLENLLVTNLIGKKVSPVEGYKPGPHSWPEGVNEGRIVSVDYYPSPINLEVMFEGDTVHVHDIGFSEFAYYRIR